MKQWLSVMVAVGMLASGCANNKPADIEVQAEQDGPSMQDLFYAEVETLELQGIEVILPRLMAMLTLPEYEEIRPVVFEYVLLVLLREDRLEESQDLYMDVAETSPELAASGFRLIMNYSLSVEDAELQIAWLERVIASSLPPLQRVSAWQSRMNAYAKAGNIALAADRVEEVMNSDLAAQAATVFSPAFSIGLKSSDYEGVEVLLVAVSGHKGRYEALDRFLLTSKGDLLIARGQLAEALDYYLANASLLGDSTLNHCLRIVLRSAQSDGQSALVNRGVDAVYALGGEFPGTRDAVAAWIVSVAAGRENPQQLFETTRKAFDNGASASRIYPAFMNGFYPAIQSDSVELRTQIKTLINDMRQVEGLSENLLSMMGTALLDAAFFEDDFKSALDVVEEGIPGFDEKWHTELKDKIKAHIALQENRFDDAVMLFSRHIERVRTWEEPATNPENGRPVIKEVVIAFNEKRIGDIWSEVEGREAAAASAYARARANYEAALEILDEGTPEYDQAKKELGDVPVAP